MKNHLIWCVCAALAVVASGASQAQQAAGDTAGVPGLECHVGNDHADGRACAHPLHGGQEAADPARKPAIGHDHSLPLITLGENRVHPDCLSKEALGSSA